MSEPAPSRMAAFKAQARKAILIFIAVDILFLALALALYLLVFEPQLAEMTADRDNAVRTGIALEARARAVEARYALTVMDVPGARMAAGDVRARLLGLAERIPADRTTEAAEVKQLVDRAALIESALDVDPHAARKDLEVLEAKLAALYPAPPARPGRE